MAATQEYPALPYDLLVDTVAILLTILQDTAAASTDSSIRADMEIADKAAKVLAGTIATERGYSVSNFISAVDAEIAAGKFRIR